MRFRDIIRLVVSVSLLGFVGCSSSKSLRIPNPDAYELKGDRYHVTLKTGWSYSTRHIRVANDSAYFNEKSVRLKEIQKIETRSFSAWKTLGLATGTTVVAIGAMWTYFIMMMMMGRSNSV